MSKRINIILPDATVAVLDRIVPKGNRSRFIDHAVLQLVKTRGTANFREPCHGPRRPTKGHEARRKCVMESIVWTASSSERLAQLFLYNR